MSRPEVVSGPHDATGRPLTGSKRSIDDEGGGSSSAPPSKRAERCDSCSPLSESSEERARSERHYMVRADDKFDCERYNVVKQLGKGTFGRVVEMWDEQERKSVAVKVVRAVDKYHREAEIESEILLEVQSGCSTELPIGHLLRTFASHGHFCLVFDKLGPSLYHALRSIRRDAERAAARKGARDHHEKKPLHAGRFFSLAQIARVARDCFRALAHLHSKRLAHTDLKPENILFAAPGRADTLSGGAGVVLIDFGGSTWEHEHHSSVVCTRQYRPPEVTLGCGWDESVDLWSMGCILAELWTGGVLFSTHDEVEHLALMERSLGSLPPGLVRRASGRKVEKNFRHGVLRWPDRAYDRDSEAHVRNQPRLKDALRGEPHIAPLRWSAQLDSFHHLVWRLLEYEPEDRLSAADALRQTFVRGGDAPPEPAPVPNLDSSSASRSNPRQP